MAVGGQPLNTLEIVLLSLFAGLLTAGLIATAAYLAWMLHVARKSLTEMTAAAASTSTDISLLATRIDAILATHRQEMSAVVSRINGDKLAEASNVIFNSAKEIKIACVAFGNLATSMLSGEIVEPELRRAERSGLGPDSYAPNPTGERWVGQSRTASQDRDELLGEGVESGEDQ